MIRALVSELLPVLLAVAIVAIFMLYSSFGIHAVVVVGLLYMLNCRMVRMEYYLSEDFRQSMFWRDRNWQLVEGLKWASAVLLLSAAYTNHRQDDRYLPVSKMLDGLSAKIMGADTTQMDLDRRIGLLEKLSSEGGGQPMVGLRAKREPDVSGRRIPTVFPKATPKKTTTVRKKPEPVSTQKPIQKPIQKRANPPIAKKSQPAVITPQPAKKKQSVGSGLPFDVKKTGEN